MNTTGKIRYYILRSRLINLLFMRRGKKAFILELPKHSKVFDIGCGNQSPESTKIIRPDLYYIGLDIGSCNNDDDSVNAADEYIITEAETFDKAIRDHEEKVDAVISNHNLEHCYDYKAVLDAMCDALKPGGLMYLAFPADNTTTFPSRKGTLNFYDDKTHINVLKMDEIIDLISDRMDIIFCVKNYKPPISRSIGAVQELFIKNRTNMFTWFYWGFETIIWAKHK